MMTSAAYLPFLIQIVLAAGIGAAIIGASHFFGQRAPRNAIQDTPYECGLKSEGIGHSRFSVKFYATALLFIVFDIEVVFLVPWAFVYREFLAHHIAILGPMMFFLFVLVLGFVYEWKKGGLEWEK
ncbi:MAG TPA: NADH-quinone oxidoreductase subunit A [Opitutaceae bacterium]|nr:NADH-quinone oxidoreductase subunit A [Opitutaceae bacterium]